MSYQISSSLGNLERWTDDPPKRFVEVVLTRAELDAAARVMYNNCPTSKPTWEQLGEVTRNVWREYVVKERNK